MELSHRLDLAMQMRKITGQSDLFRRSGVPQPTINRILKGRTSTPDSETIRKLADALDVPFLWLLKGEGSVFDLDHEEGKTLSHDSVRYSHVWGYSDDQNRAGEKIWLDLFEYKFSSETGLIQWEIREKEFVPFSPSFFEERRLKVDDCRLMNVHGDSMSPWAEDRNVIIVDTSQTTILDGERYAIWFQMEPLVKQVFKEVDGSLILHSYNERFPDKKVPFEKLDLITIVGKIVYRAG